MSNLPDGVTQAMLDERFSYYTDTCPEVIAAEILFSKELVAKNLENIIADLTENDNFKNMTLQFIDSYFKPYNAESNIEYDVITFKFGAMLSEAIKNYLTENKEFILQQAHNIAEDKRTNNFNY